MTRSNKSVSLEDDVVEKIKKFGSLQTFGPLEDIPFSYKIEEMVNDFHNMVYFTEREIFNLFTFEEICLLCDISNGTMYSSNIGLPMVLNCSIMDADKYEGVCEKWNVNLEDLIPKIKQLTSLQAYVLLLKVSEFWRENRSSDFFDDIERIFKVKRP